ncbi:MAG: ferredoxin family protein [Lentisphaerae bacterium]|jgi:NAD-dependent dihydropyrimidine dehydrogenase PreA subunit|nr:ferredoxin family protein [Lentisphaerota bacterium]
MSQASLEAEKNTVPEPIINEDHCKGCGRCIAACPRKVLRFKSTLNLRSVRPAEYIGTGCIGCNFCFYNCPEPFAIEVYGAAKKGS